MGDTARSWRDADLSPLGIAPVGVDASDDEILASGLTHLTAVRSGEGYLKWVELQQIADMLDVKRSLAAEADDEQFSRMLDPHAQLATTIATVLSIGQEAAERRVDLADSIRNRVPNSGILLRDGIISPSAFSKIVSETAAIVDDQLLAQADREIADDTRASGNVGYYDVQHAARAIVATLDADAARKARERNKPAARIQVWPAGPGYATLAITNTVENIAKAEAVLDAEADKPIDPLLEPVERRTKAQRRSDAAISLITDPDADHSGARLVVHVITDGSTLAGGDKPGHLEGQGAIDAGHVRDIAAAPGTLIRDLDLTELTRHSAQSADPYRPTTLLDTVARGLFGTCSWPGCTRPAWKADLDHVAEFNHHDPGAGGPTCLCNLNPKCRFHHQVKTFGDGWLDDQIIDAHGVVWTEVTTPEGFTRRSRAANTWLLPDAGLIPCGHAPPTRPGTVDTTDDPKRGQTRTEAKHAYRLSLRARNRRYRSVGPPGLEPGTSGL